MKKLLTTAMLMATSLFGGFNFGECSGSGTFEQQIVHYGGNFKKDAIKPLTKHIKLCYNTE